MGYNDKDDEARNLPVCFSFVFFDPRVKIDLLNNLLCGRSELKLDFRDPRRLSDESGDIDPVSLPNEDVALVAVFVLECVDSVFLFICSVYALILPGDGGPSMAASVDN
jgi:hypothetical protein